MTSAIDQDFKQSNYQNNLMICQPNNQAKNKRYFCYIDKRTKSYFDKNNISFLYIFAE